MQDDVAALRRVVGDGEVQCTHAHVLALTQAHVPLHTATPVFHRDPRLPLPSVSPSRHGV